MVMPSVECDVSTSGASIETVTLSSRPPSVSLTSTRLVSPTETSMPGRTIGLNPVTVALRS
jgi:hypothetical protein